MSEPLIGPVQPGAEELAAEREETLERFFTALDAIEAVRSAAVPTHRDAEDRDVAGGRADDRLPPTNRKEHARDRGAGSA